MTTDRPVQDALWSQPGEHTHGPVECLGMTFESDEARRAYFLAKLREKLKDPEFRKIEGFPIGDDEDILRLSDPPYYTACPNPFIEDFIRCYGRPYDPEHDDYHREPYAADVSEGKNDPIYNAHSYHTKVPHEAIMRYILHYTHPGDIVYDGFCGSGMTGVAAQLCGDRAAVESLGYRVEGDTVYDGDRAISRLGARRAILVDLSPAATFIAYNYNTPVDAQAFQREARRILRELGDELGWMYETWHPHSEHPLKSRAPIDYAVWSEVFRCRECGGEITFLDEAYDPESGRVRASFRCPYCGAELTRDNLDKTLTAVYDPILGSALETPVRKPVLIAYRVHGSRCTKRVDQADRELLSRIEALPAPAETVANELPFMHMTHQRANMARQGITHIHHFFLPRARHALSLLWVRADAVSDPRLRAFLLFAVEQAIWSMSLLNRYRPAGYSQVNQYLSGVYYVPSQISEVSPWYVLDGKVRRLAATIRGMHLDPGRACVATMSAGASSVAEDSVDYIFTDPPFGENIYYADLNYLVESWHRVWTNSQPEAIIDRAKRKGLSDYQQLMTACFRSYYRWLKPGRWITVVFHNSHNAVWNAILQALGEAGFVVVDVRTLDKQTGSYRQVTTTRTAKQDLVVSAYKPNQGLERRFELQAGTEAGAWDFVRTHMRQLPAFIAEKGRLVIVRERMRDRLYDAMVAFHVQRGVTVPLSASEFSAGLKQRFDERDGMYFLPEQAALYDQKRAEVKEVAQLQLIITGEESAIQWLRLQLERHPQTFQELQPQFMREIGGWDRHEKPLELLELLEENFICYDGRGPVPAQIHRYLGSTDEALRDLAADDPRMIAAARDRWYVPDPNRAADLEKLRERTLLREFDQYRKSKERKLKVFRLEAVRAGFKRAWQERDYHTILEVARKIPEDVLEEDPRLLMWREQARTRSGGDE